MRSVKVNVHPMDEVHRLRFAFEKTKQADDKTKNDAAYGGAGQGCRDSNNGADVALDFGGEQQRRTGVNSLQAAGHDHCRLRVLQRRLIGERQTNPAVVHVHIFGCDHEGAALANLNVIGVDVLGAALLDDNLIGCDVSRR